MQEIWRHGYRAASVKALSEKLGITRSSFYNAFGSRETLFQLALRRYLTEIPSGRLFSLDRDTPLKPALTEIFRALCACRGRDIAQRGCMVSNAIAEMLPGDDDAACLVLKLSMDTIDRIEELVTWAIERGELDETDPRVLAICTQNLMIGINMQSKFGLSGETLWATAKRTLQGLGLYASLAESNVEP